MNADASSNAAMNAADASSDAAISAGATLNAATRGAASDAAPHAGASWDTAPRGASSENDAGSAGAPAAAEIQNILVTQVKPATADGSSASASESAAAGGGGNGSEGEVHVPLGGGGRGFAIGSRGAVSCGMCSCPSACIWRMCMRVRVCSACAYVCIRVYGNPRLFRQ